MTGNPPFCQELQFTSQLTTRT